MIKIRLKVKFRAFFIDFYKMDQVFPLPIPVPVSLPATPERVIYNDHGVYLSAWVG